MTRIARIVAASRPKRQCKAQAAAITGSATVHAKNADEAATERARRFSKRRSGSRTTDALWATVGPRRSTALADARNWPDGLGAESDTGVGSPSHPESFGTGNAIRRRRLTMAAPGHRLAGRTRRNGTAARRLCGGDTHVRPLTIRPADVRRPEQGAGQPISTGSHIWSEFFVWAPPAPQAFQWLFREWVPPSAIRASRARFVPGSASRHTGCRRRDNAPQPTRAGSAFGFGCRAGIRPVFASGGTMNSAGSLRDFRRLGAREIGYSGREARRQRRATTGADRRALQPTESGFARPSTKPSRRRCRG